MSQSKFPIWLNSNFFEIILQKNYKNTSIKVHEVQIEHCGAASDGFLSTLLRVHVTYFMNSQCELESFVVKIPTTQEFVLEKVGSNGYDVQNKEMLFYEVVAPQLEKLLKSIGEKGKLFPAVVAVDRLHDAIVFEDLRNFNFVMVDRINGMDKNQVELAIKKLATFHAATRILQEKRPEVFNSFDTGMFNRKVAGFDIAWISIFEFATAEIATWSGFERYATKMRKIQSQLIESGRRCFDVESTDFNVLNHGDLWTNNLMFTYDESHEADKAILVSITTTLIPQYSTCLF